MSGQPPFAETSYGVVKRLDVVEEWVAEASSRMGNPRLRILDYGCGTGDQLTVPLARGGHDVLGVDMHPESIAAAQSRYSHDHLTFRVASLDTLIQESCVFDVVVCSEVLEHVDDPASFLRSLSALLAPAGVLILTTPNGFGAFEWLSSLERAFQRTGVHSLIRSTVWNARKAARAVRGLPVPSSPLDGITEKNVGFINIDSGHVQFFSLRRLEALFAGAGLQIVARRARTLLCGPYVDVLLALMPGRSHWYRWNGAAADNLPFACAADWMFVLTRAR